MTVRPASACFAPENPLDRLRRSNGHCDPFSAGQRITTRKGTEGAKLTGQTCSLRPDGDFDSTTPPPQQPSARLLQCSVLTFGVHESSAMGALFHARAKILLAPKLVLRTHLSCPGAVESGQRRFPPSAHHKPAQDPPDPPQKRICRRATSTTDVPGSRSPLGQV